VTENLRWGRGAKSASPSLFVPFFNIQHDSFTELTSFTATELADIMRLVMGSTYVGCSRNICLLTHLSKQPSFFSRFKLLGKLGGPMPNSPHDDCVQEEDTRLTIDVNTPSNDRFNMRLSRKTCKVISKVLNPLLSGVIGILVGVNAPYVWSSSERAVHSCQMPNQTSISGQN
jgi:hypothetical protein